MKKIVALVLSLVMVLGLATVAFADTTATTLKLADGYKIYAIDGTDAINTEDVVKTVTGNVTTTTTAEKTTVKYTATTFKSGTTLFAEVDSSVATYKLVNGTSIVAYLLPVAEAPATTVVATSFIEAKKVAAQVCEDVKADAYVIDGKAYVAGGNEWAVLNGKFVKYTNTLVEKVAHTYDPDTYSTTDKSITSVKCPACKATWTVLSAKDVATMAPSAYAYVDVTDGSDQYIALGATAAAGTTGTVGSAKTFDAGIAMYVGMSVMAAAGSAVILKKREA